jgi:hypothetical protein
MSVEQFPNKQWVRILSTDETVLIGGFQFPNHCELVYGNLSVIKKGAMSGTPRARLHFYSTVDMANIVYTSDWRTLSDITGLGGSNSWLGWVRFDFDRQNINKNITYYVGVEMDSYTADLTDETFWIGFALDGPVYTYESDIEYHKQGKIEFYTMQNIDWSGG